MQAASAVISVVGSKRHRNEGWSPGSMDHRVGDEQQVELAAFGNAGDLLDDRELHMAGGGALIAPSGRMVAGAEDEDPEMHLPLLRAHAAYLPR